MYFIYTIDYWTVDGAYVRRHGEGEFYPSNSMFNIEDMLWLMAEELGRPTKIEVKWDFVKQLR